MADVLNLLIKIGPVVLLFGLIASIALAVFGSRAATTMRQGGSAVTFWAPS